MNGDAELEEGEIVEGEVCVTDLDHIIYLGERLERALGDRQPFLSHFANEHFKGRLFHATSNRREGADFRKYERSRGSRDNDNYWKEGADFRKYERSRGSRDNDNYWKEGSETGAGTKVNVAEREYVRYVRHRDDRYREREDSSNYRYRDSKNRYERRGSRENRFRDRDREKERERDRRRENCTKDRGGHVREDRYSRDRSVRQDGGGRPFSLKSRVDKQGSRHNESRLVRDLAREGTVYRIQDYNPEVKHEKRSTYVKGLKDDQPCEDEREAKPLITRSTEGASSRLSKMEHNSLGKSFTQEGTELKHIADRLNNVASTEVETSNLYMQASLKYLLSADQFEMASMSDERQESSGREIKLYNETALLFEHCASTYERRRDYAASALAHICAALARFRAVMGKSRSFKNDCMELGGGLHWGKQKSPSSSSGEEVDNLSNPALTVAGNKVISGSLELVPQQSQKTFHRAIQNAMDVSAMMESWAKAQIATAAMETACAGVPGQQEGVVAVKGVVGIGFLGSMDAVVRQVRIALDAIGH